LNLEDCKPTWPREALRGNNKQAGVVTVTADIDAAGNVSNVNIQNSTLPATYGRTVTAALQNCKFQPDASGYKIIWPVEYKIDGE
jgi:TonB family protein